MAVFLSSSSTSNCLLSILARANITSPLLNLPANVDKPFLENWSKHRPQYDQSFKHFEGVTKDQNGFFCLPNMNFQDPKKLIDSIARSIIEYKGYNYNKIDCTILAAILCQLNEKLNDGFGMWGHVSIDYIFNHAI